jgi:hypothetical protein
MLRWLKRIGIDVRTYRCAMCGYETAIRQEEDRSVRVRQEPAGAARRVRSKRQAAKRRSLRWLAFLIPLVLIVAALAAYQLLSARQHLLRGVQDLRSARATLSLPGIWHDAATRARTRATLQQAEQEFADAHSDLRLWSPLIDHLGWVPRVGGQLAAASPATDLALHTTRSAIHLLDGLSPLWPVLDGRRSSAGTLAKAAAALQAGHAQFLLAQSDANQAALTLRRLPSRSGNATLDRATAELRAKLPAIRASTSWLTAAPAILGMNGESHYLLALQDPAELRATGGFIGAGDFVTLHDGSLHSDFFGSALPYEIDSVPTPLPEALYTAEGPWIFRDSNWSPDFPLSARLERWFYGKDTGRWADGVVDIVDTAIDRILAATGPVYVPQYREWVNADNVDALAQQYKTGTYHGPLTKGSGDTIAKQFLGDVISALFQRVQSLPADRFPVLGTALSDEIARRDIMLYDRRSAIQAAVVQSRADGRLLPASGDFLAIVDDNRSYNKLNPYVHEQATYRVDMEPDLWLNATLAIRYHVAPSPSNLEGAGPGFGLWGTKHDYQDFLRVYVPAGARLQQMSGADRWAPAPAYGLTQFAGRVLVREGQTRTVTIRYRVPANVFSSSSFHRYLLTVQHQPGANLSSVSVSLRALGGLTLDTEHGAGTSRNRVLQLDKDAHIQAHVDGDIHPRVEPLPRQTGPEDPYIPFSYLHDPKHGF